MNVRSGSLREYGMSGDKLSASANLFHDETHYIHGGHARLDYRLDSGDVRRNTQPLLSAPRQLRAVGDVTDRAEWLSSRYHLRADVAIRLSPERTAFLDQYSRTLRPHKCKVVSAVGGIKKYPSAIRRPATTSSRVRCVCVSARQPYASDNLPRGGE